MPAAHVTICCPALPPAAGPGIPTVMKISAHPLVVAAALGLLGPAALADDDEPAGLGGVWARADGDGQSRSPGARIEIIPVEDRLWVDGGEAGAATWTRLDADRASLDRTDGAARIQHLIEADGDHLVVRTRVCESGSCVEYDERYVRVG
jgi:hypothetical protein